MYEQKCEPGLKLGTLAHEAIGTDDDRVFTFG